MGPPSVDLFASRLNHKAKCYVSLEPDPCAIAVDAFSIDWSKFESCYAFPPFNMIGKVLPKCVQDKVNLTLVVPNWHTQHWFPLLFDLKIDVTDNPLTLPVSTSSVMLPYKTDVIHPIWHRLNLMCFRINGNS